MPADSSTHLSPGFAPTPPRRWAHLAALALVFTALNAVKPPVVDDGYFLTFARQIADHPRDPYGFSFCWWYWNESAFTQVSPPVVPYWLGLGMNVVGSGVAALKLWLLPFAFLFLASADVLLRRFARPAATPFLYFIAFSPLFLPGFNLMLDVPAEGLILASLVVFLVALDRDSLPLAVAAGAVAAAAAQTKYTGLSAPAVMVGGALLVRRPRLALAGAMTFALLFCAWEGWLYHLYGQSHFAVSWQMRDNLRQSPKMQVVECLLAVPGTMLLALIPLGVLGMGGKARVALGVAAAAVVAMALGLFNVVPPLGDDIALGILFYAVVAAAVMRCPWTPADRFLAGWLVVEILVAFFASPFPASRRLFGLAIPCVVIVARAISARTDLTTPRVRWAVYGLVALNAAVGAFFYSVDLQYALKVHNALADLRQLIHEKPGARVHLLSSWSGLYDGPALGYDIINPDESRIYKDDWIVTPLAGLYFVPYRVDPQDAARQMNPAVARESPGEPVPTVVVPNVIPFSTLGQYSEVVPVVYDTGPVFAAYVYRAKRDFVFRSHLDPARLTRWLESRNFPIPPAAAPAVADLMATGTPAQAGVARQALWAAGDEAMARLADAADVRVRAWALAARDLKSHGADEPPKFPLPPPPATHRAE